MKLINKSSLLGLAGAALIATQANGAVTTASGDLAVAFYQVNPGNALGANTYIFKLGSASNFRENTPSANSLVSSVTGGPASANIAADLVTAFGSDWMSSGTVRWMVIGGVSSTGGLTNGDPARTSYLSRSVPTIPASGTATSWGSALSTTNGGTLNTNIFSVLNATSNETSGDNANGAIIARTQSGTVEEFLPPTTATFFGISSAYNPTQTLGSGTITNNNSSAAALGTIEGALDMYRVAYSGSSTLATGTDLTSGFSSSDATARSGQYIGTLVLTTTGNLHIIPEPSSALLGAAGVLGLCLRRRRNA